MGSYHETVGGTFHHGYLINYVGPNKSTSTFLVTIIDENLNWKPHIQLVKSKLSKTLNIIYEASKI